MQIVQLQISYCKLKIKINAKIEVFSIYVTLLDDKETLENSCINTQSNIIATY